MSIRVICERGDADKQAPDIIDPMINTEEMAVSRGKRELDNTVKRRQMVLSVPHKGAAVIPGRWIQMTVADLNLASAMVKIKTYDFGGDSSGVTSATIGVEKYETE